MSRADRSHRFEKEMGIYLREKWTKSTCVSASLHVILPELKQINALDSINSSCNVEMLSGDNE